MCDTKNMITKGLFLVPHIDSRANIIDNERPGASPCSSLFQGSYTFLLSKFTPYNRLSGQQMLSGTQIISTSHGMTGRTFFDIFLPFYLLFGF